MKLPLPAAVAALFLSLLGPAPAVEAQTWTPIFERDVRLREFAAADGRQLILFSVPGTLLRSADGGVTWTESAAPKSAWSLQATHPDTVWLWSGDSLLRSVDGASTWTLRSTVDFYAIGSQFLNGTQGFLASPQGGLHATLDGGATWLPRRSGSGNRKGFAQLYFLDPARGFAVEIDSSVTSPGTYSIHRTADSGKTWTPLSLPSDFQASTEFLRILRFDSPQQGAINLYTTAGLRVELSTMDGGVSWNRRDIPKPDSIRVHGYIGESFLYGIDGHRSTIGKLTISRDGGTTWIPTTAIFPSQVESMHWRNPDTGWAFASGFLFRTVDGGTTWTRQIATLTGGFLSDFLFQDPLTGWVTQGSHIYRTENGGRLWSLQATSESTRWHSLHLSDFPGARTLFAVGTRQTANSGSFNYVLGASRDEGLTWKEVELDTIVKVRDLAFGSSQAGYALIDHTDRDSTDHDSLGLLKTTDRGDSWQLIRLPYRAIGLRIQFLDGNVGFIAARSLEQDSALVLRVSQGGTAHALVAKFPRSGFAGMHWEDAARGWVLSRDTVHKTVDGGATWTKTGLGTWKESIRAIAVDARNVAVIDLTGKLLRTSDGFATWSVEALPVAIHDLQFLPSGEGYVLGRSNSEFLRFTPRPGPVAVRHKSRPARPSGNGGPRFESGVMRFPSLPSGRGRPREVDAAGRGVEAR